MRTRVENLSHGTISADDNSIYRALNRFAEIGVVNSELQPSNQGPARRYYSLTGQGQELLRCFVERNILLFRDEEVEQRVEKVMQ